MKKIEQIHLYSLILLIGLLFPLDMFAADSFVRNLTVGSRGEDVRSLQVLLNQDASTRIAVTGVGSVGNETNYFGNLTKQAVIRFQNKYANEILKPVGLSFGTGFVGASTRAQLNALMGGLNQNVTTFVPEHIKEEVENRPNNAVVVQDVGITEISAPKINSISPAIGNNGTEITLMGKNFADKNTVVVMFDPKDRYTDIPSQNNGTELSFVLNSDVGTYFENSINKYDIKNKLELRQKFPKTPLNITVMNEFGTSTYTVFILDVTK